MVYNLSMKEITDQLYIAFVKCHNTKFEDEEVHAEYQKLATEFLGTDDGLEQCKLVVKLTKAFLEIEGDWRKE